MTKGVLSSANSQELKLLVSSPRLASGNSLQKFRTSNSCLRQFDSQGFLRIEFQLVWATKISPHDDDGFGQLTQLCRECTLSRVKIQSRAFAAIPGGTIIGPVIEVQIVKILDQYGLEIAIPSPFPSPTRTSCVMISRGTCRFVDDVHIPNAELRSSAELLSEVQKSGGGESCLAQSKTSIQETGAVHVTSQTNNKETCADTLSITPSQASLFTRRTIPTTERKWKAIPANSSYGGALSIAVSKMVTRMGRHQQWLRLNS